MYCVSNALASGLHTHLELVREKGKNSEPWVVRAVGLDKEEEQDQKGSRERGQTDRGQAPYCCVLWVTIGALQHRYLDVKGVEMHISAHNEPCVGTYLDLWCDCHVIACRAVESAQEALDEEDSANRK